MTQASQHLSLTALGLLLLATAGSARELLQSSTSSLWGRNGERYTVGGRLLDYSYAGYKAGEDAIPNLRTTHDVKRYGAKGNGRTDDSAAFQRAVDDMDDGDVLRVPAGRYIISRQITIGRSVSIKGDGSGDVEVIITKGVSLAIFRYQGLLLGTRTKLTDVQGTAKRGTNDVRVRSSSGIEQGKWIAVTMGSPRGGNHFLAINQGLHEGCNDETYCSGDYVFMHFSRVAAVRGNQVTLERPLPWDLYEDYSPVAVHAWRPSVSNVGIEGLSITMRSAPYLGHFKERGFNAIEFFGIGNAWIRDIHITDCDTGIRVTRSAFVTVEDIKFYATRGRAFDSGGANFNGHHGISVSVAADVLVQNFEFNAKWVHDLSTDKFAKGTVWSKGKGVDMNMDHHKAQNYGTLWTDLDVGQATRPFNSGGGETRGMNAGTFTTYWNIRSNRPFSSIRKDLDEGEYGPYLNFIGLPQGTQLPPLSGRVARTWLVEWITPGSRGNPTNLYEAMKNLRLSSPNKVSTLLGGQGQGGDMLD